VIGALFDAFMAVLGVLMKGMTRNYLASPFDYGRGRCLVGIAFSSGFRAITLYISLEMDPQDFEMATVRLSGSLYSTTRIHILAYSMDNNFNANHLMEIAQAKPIKFG